MECPHLHEMKPRNLYLSVPKWKRSRTTQRKSPPVQVTSVVDQKQTSPKSDDILDYLLRLVAIDERHLFIAMTTYREEFEQLREILLSKLRRENPSMKTQRCPIFWTKKTAARTKDGTTTFIF